MFCRASAANNQLAACRILMWICWIFSHCVRLTWVGPQRGDLHKYFHTAMHHPLAISSIKVRFVMKTDYLSSKKSWYFGNVTLKVVVDWLIVELLEARTSVPCPDTWYFNKLHTSVRPFFLEVSHPRKGYIQFSETHCEHHAIGVDPTLVFSNSLSLQIPTWW
jgi:hypothetical protein